MLQSVGITKTKDFTESNTRDETKISHVESVFSFFFVKPEKPMKAELTFRDKQSHLWIICAYHNPGMIEENKVT